MNSLEALIAEKLQRRFVRLVGRGTTALYVALRAFALRDGIGEAILPDVICSNVLDAVLLAGFTPLFANVSPSHFAVDPNSIQHQISSSTRAIIAPHLFGFTTSIPANGIPVIEDAVQGLGGSVNGAPVGSLGDISFVSFNETKMICGQGAAIATDDETLWDAVQSVRLDDFYPKVTSSDEEGMRVNSYLHQLSTVRDTLIRPFDDRPENRERIISSWQALPDNVASRNEKAQYLRDQLSDLPLQLPEICKGDAIWRYSFIAPNRASASWMLRHLQRAGLSGSNLYPSLSNIFSPNGALFSQSFAPNIINLWVDAATSYVQLDRAIEIIRATPKLGE